MTEFLDRNIIVIEGLGGAGKTTAAQGLAQRYGYINLNTGTLFRASAAAARLEGVQDTEIDSFLGQAKFELDTTSPTKPLVAVSGRDVSDLLQTPEVSRAASKIGRLKAAERLEALFNQRLLEGNIVVEGKHLADRMGAVATKMFFFWATQEVRAYRKWEQAQQMGHRHYTIHEAIADTIANDKRDKQLLTVGQNTRIIDTTHLSKGMVVTAVARHMGLERLML